MRAIPAAALALSVLSGLAACASSDDTPLVGTVSVAAARTRVPIGSPLDLTYRFELTGAPVTEDYEVFVHFVNADGQTIWVDDHPPATPTSQWRVGTPVEYNRTVFLPSSILHPGDIGVEVGLYRGGDRLPLRGPRPAEDASARAYRVVDLQFAPESENVFLIYQSGWHQDEFASEEPTRPWRWTQKAATIAFRHPKADAEMLLEFAGRPDYFADAPQQLTVLDAAGDPITSFPVESAEPVLRRIPLTSAQMGTADLAELHLEVDRTFVPAETGEGGEDTRVLGVRVYNVHIVAH